MKHILSLLVAVCMLLGINASPAEAVTWPAESAWTALEWNSAPYGDVVEDENPDWIDVVGSSTHVAGYMHLDDMGTGLTTDDILMFRMRLHENGLGRNSVWQFAIDTDMDGGMNWSLQLDGKTDNRVEFVIATSPGPPFAIPPGTNPVEYDGANAYWSSTDLAAYRRWSAAGDGSNFGGDADAFLDIAMPWDEFSTITGETDLEFDVALTTSTDHNNTNKDHPDDDGIITPIPEPATVVVVLTALAGLGGYLRKRLID